MKENDLVFPYTNKAGSVHHKGITLKAYAAIQLKVPNSGIDWLDEMITEHNDNQKEIYNITIDPNSGIV